MPNKTQSNTTTQTNNSKHLSQTTISNKTPQATTKLNQIKSELNQQIIKQAKTNQTT